MQNNSGYVGPFLDAERKNEHSANNFFHTVLIISAIAGILLICSWIISGISGVIFSLVLVAVLFVFIRRVPGSMVMRMYRASPVDSRHGHEFERILEILSDRAELASKPLLYIIPSSTLNAFATGSQNKPYIAVTEGLLRRLELREIAAVLAHEVSHIRNDDLKVMALADAMSRITQLMSYIGIFLILFNLPLMFFGSKPFPWLGAILLYFAPTFSSLLQLALSRTREFDADLEGASLTGDPEGLALALEKLEHYQGAFWEDMILPGRRIPQPSLLRSHPPTAERIARLKDLKPALPPISISTSPMITMVGAGPATLHPRFHFPWPGIWY